MWPFLRRLHPKLLAILGEQVVVTPGDAKNPKIDLSIATASHW
jgi:hypothetical protein